MDWKPEIRLKMRRRSPAPLPLFVFLGRCSWYCLVTVRSVIQNAIVPRAQSVPNFPRAHGARGATTLALSLWHVVCLSSLFQVMLLKPVHTHTPQVKEALEARASSTDVGHRSQHIEWRTLRKLININPGQVLRMFPQR
jgi:hypothetical protein